MRASIARSATLGMFLAAACLTAALAADPGDTSNGAHPVGGQPAAVNGNGALTHANPTHVLPSKMTPAECETFGGTVVYAPSCYRSLACTRTDDNGVVRSVCLAPRK